MYNTPLIPIQDFEGKLLSFEKADLVTTDLLYFMAIIDISAEIKMDNVPPYVSKIMKQLFYTACV